MKTPSQILKEAKELISDESRWTKGSDAQDAEGFDTSALSRDAVCWCASGAVLVAEDAAGFSKGGVGKFLRTSSPTGSYVDFNDDPNTTHQDIMNLFDKAIKLAESEEA